MTDTPQAPLDDLREELAIENAELKEHDRISRALVARLTDGKTAAIIRAETAERQRDELLDVILAQAKRSIASIPHDIWAAAVRINKEINPHPVNPAP